MALSINPSYRTMETTYGSCPPYDFIDSKETAAKYTLNYPLIHGDSMIGIYGADYQRFIGAGQNKCFSSDYCAHNSMTPLFYRPPRQILHPTYGVVYRGKDQYYRKPFPDDFVP